MNLQQRRQENLAFEVG